MFRHALDLTCSAGSVALARTRETMMNPTSALTMVLSNAADAKPCGVIKFPVSHALVLQTESRSPADNYFCCNQAAFSSCHPKAQSESASACTKILCEQTSKLRVVQIQPSRFQQSSAPRAISSIQLFNDNLQTRVCKSIRITPVYQKVRN